MTKEQKEAVESSLADFVVRVAKSGTEAEVSALPDAVRALIDLQHFNFVKQS